jgi:hypothetical protein
MARSVKNDRTDVATAVSGKRLAPVFILLVSLSLAISSCGGGSSGNSGSSPGNSLVAGNWQFTMSTNGNSFVASPLQGGLIQQANGSLSGQVMFSILLPGAGTSTTICNSGTATVTGTVSGQTVNFTAVVGTFESDGATPATQTFTLSNGQLSSDNSTIQGGTYTVTAGYSTINGAVVTCGSAQDAGSWSAASIPSMTGTFQGNFHSTAGSSGLANQDFAVTGSLLQGPNTGASSATITGTLTFTGYPCFSSISVNGQISGNSVVLQMFPSTGVNAGQIGGINPLTPVTYDNTSSGYVLHNLAGVGYAVINAKNCTGASLQNAGDTGNLCLAWVSSTTLNTPTACTQPITLLPAAISFTPQFLGSASRARQLITLTNTDPSGAALNGLTISFLENDSDLFFQQGGGDFNGVPNLTEQDTCANSPGSPFNLESQQSCTITISFAPQESCPWLPYQSSGNPSIDGLPPAKCPGLFNQNIPVSSILGATLTVTSPSSADGDGSFSVPIKGAGLSSVVPSTPELDFGAEDLGESSQPQTVTFINQGSEPVQILPTVDISQSCNIANGSIPKPFYLPRPAQSGEVPGLVVTTFGGAISSMLPVVPPTVSTPSIQYYCDIATAGGLANFQLLSDQCSGMTLVPQQTCNVQLTYVPQPDYTPFLGSKGLDFFLELNTIGEIDSGRFPVELKANFPSPLRMSPGAGLDFGVWLKGELSGPLTITLTNDQKDNLTVNITGKSITGTDYLETDNCPATLSSGSSCTLSFTFQPSISGSDQSQFTITYNTVENQQFGLTQYIYLRGFGQ